MHDLGKGLCGVDSRGGAHEAFEGVFCFFKTATPDEMPRGFGAEEENGKKNDRPHPLHEEGDLVAPFAGHVDETRKNASSNKLADDETHVCKRCEVGAERLRENFARVGRGNGCERASWETTHENSDAENRGVGGEEDYC